MARVVVASEAKRRPEMEEAHLENELENLHLEVRSLDCLDPLPSLAFSTLLSCSETRPRKQEK